MASAAESLASNLSLSAFSKATELKSRLLFTVLALIVYRVGTYIPVPGVDPVMLGDIFRQHAGGILGMFDMFSGGALKRMTVFALGVMPYITASIIVQLLTAILPQFEALKKEGQQGQVTLNQYSRYLTVVFAVFQSLGVGFWLENMGGSQGSVVTIPSVYFLVMTVATLTCGTVFLMWLGEQITSRGIGNGISLIILSGIVAQLPSAIAGTLELGRQGALSTGLILAVLLMAVAVIAFIVFMERAQRRLLIQYPKRQVGNRMFEGQSSHLPLKLNTSGVIPPIFASSLLLLPTTISTFSGNQTGPIMSTILAYFGPGQPFYLLFFTVMIVFFTFFYTHNVAFKVEDVASNLKNQNGFVPGIRPGKKTEEYFTYVMNRILVIGAAYLAFVCLLPEILRHQFSIPFYFGGTSVLIVVSVAMDTVSQIQSHLLAHQYEGLIERSQLRGKKRTGQRKAPTRR
ncbi:MAG: preprotein translocase subunit SecY [Paracoccaceae bacterium]|nr:preprotein translocase subunit SecY [Paracoccaceae bacterium]